MRELQTGTERSVQQCSFALKSALLVLISCCLGYAARRCQIDDAFIYARYMSNAFAGHGLVFNVGEHVNALTSPLYTYVLLGTTWLLHGKVLVASAVLSVVFLASASILAERLVPFAGFALATTAFFYLLVGMESALFVFLLLLAVTIYLEDGIEYMPLISVLVLLTRFEGGALLLVLAWDTWKRRRLPRWYSYLPAVAILATYFVLNHQWYGAWLPNSTTAKIFHGFSGYWGRWPKAFPAGTVINLREPFERTPYIAAFGVILGIAGIRKMKGSRFNNLVFPFLVIVGSFYVLFNIPGYRWYSAPFVCFALIYACYALPKTKLWMGIFAGAMAMQFATNYFYLENITDGFWTSPYVQTGEWFAKNTPPDTTIEAVETGTVTYFSNRRMLDVVGLTTPKNAVHLEHHDINSWIREDKPDYILIHTKPYIWEKAAITSPDYAPLPFGFGPVRILKCLTCRNTEAHYQQPDRHNSSQASGRALN